MTIKDKLRVMVVDDHRSSRMLTVQAIKDLGIKNVTIAKNGQDAFTAAVNSPVHLIITDLYMPNINGLQLIKAVRAHPKIKKTGVLIITAKKDAKVVELSQSLGVNNILSKPFSNAVLQLGIESVVGKLDE